MLSVDSNTADAVFVNGGVMFFVCSDFWSSGNCFFFVPHGKKKSWSPGGGVRVFSVAGGRPRSFVLAFVGRHMHATYWRLGSIIYTYIHTHT